MKIIPAFVFLVIILFPIYGQEIETSAENQAELSTEMNSIKKNYSLSVGPQIGFIYGQAFELVYPGPEGAKGELLSELIWDMKPVLYSGIKIDFGRTNIMSAPGFFTSVSLKAGISAASGIMEDRDWQSTQNALLTNFSSHDNKTQSLLVADLYTGASIPIKSFFYIKPFLSGSWMHFSFSATDGYLQHAKVSGGIYSPIEEAQKQYVSGVVITYKQDWLLLSAGLSIGTHILYPFTIDLSFQMSPLAYCAATDEHMIPNGTVNDVIVYGERKKIFKDFTYFGMFFEPAVNISLVLNQIEFSLNFSYRHIDKSKGKTYIKNDFETKYTKSPNAPGAGLSIFDTRFLFIIHL